MPIGCVMGRADIMDAAQPGTLGGTYLGNPVCCAAALATLEHMEKIDINTLGDKVGRIVRRRMDQWRKRYPRHIGHVRGLGAMLAFELVKDGDPAQPDAALTKKIIEVCERQGLIIISAGTYANVVRILSPLTIPEKTLRQGLDILEKALEECCE
jgi:4-aminobutyrate aminotransferase/(S)-3-amino-2-methylpropionate transaminase